MTDRAADTTSLRPAAVRTGAARPARLLAAARACPAWAVATAGYAALAVALTWPLALHLGDRFPGQRPDDAYGHYWNLWWFKEAVLAGRNPYHTPLWYPPDGTDLYAGTLAPVNGLLGLPPQLLFGPLVAYNLLVLLNITLAGLATFLLARRVTGHVGGAAIAGLVMAASPFLIYQLNIGHLNVVALYGLPLFCYCLLRAADGSRRHLLLAGPAFLLAALAEWQTAISALLAAGVLLTAALLAAGFRRRAWGAPARMVAAGAIAGLLALPFAVVTARAIDAAGATARLGQEVNRSANLLAFHLPQELHPLWGDAIHQWRRANLWEPVTSGMMSLGLVALALAALGLARGGRAALPWLAVLALGVGLALGPELHIGHAAVPGPTPFGLLQSLPYLDASRNPARYVVLAGLGVAVLAAFGARWLATRPRLRPRAGLVVAAVGALILAEMWRAPFPLSVPPDTAVAERVGREIAAIDPAGAVLTLPDKADEQYILFHQVHHRRPFYSTAGAVSRLPKPPLRANTPGFADLVQDRAYRDIARPAVEPLAALNAFHVRYVLFYPGEVPERELAGYRRRLERVLGQPGPAYVAADGQLEAWRVPIVVDVAPFLRIGDGWQRVENWDGVGAGRWLRDEGEAHLEALGGRGATLHLLAVSFARPRTLEVRLDGELLAVEAVGTTPTPVTVTLPPGRERATLTFEAREGVNARDQEAFGDKRPLTIGIAEIELTPMDEAGEAPFGGVE
jgi:hypothetical protein